MREEVAVGLAVLSEERGWGLLNAFSLPSLLIIVDICRSGGGLGLIISKQGKRSSAAKRSWKRGPPWPR